VRCVGIIIIRFFRSGRVMALALAVSLAAPAALALTAPQFGRGNRQQRAEQPRIRKQRLQQQLMRAIGLTDEQRARMADIRRGYDEELAATGRRLRQSRQALDRAIMGERFDQGLIDQRTEELAAAQADMIRLQSRVRAQVRSVLTAEQVTRFHQIERQMRRQMREQRRTEAEKVQEQGAAAPRTPLDEEADLLSLLYPPPRSRP
jgi:Spy/CpxP family protein refolding chaperone